MAAQRRTLPVDTTKLREERNEIIQRLEMQTAIGPLARKLAGRLKERSAQAAIEAVKNSQRPNLAILPATATNLSSSQSLPAFRISAADLSVGYSATQRILAHQSRLGPPPPVEPDTNSLALASPFHSVFNRVQSAVQRSSAIRKRRIKTSIGDKQQRNVKQSATAEQQKTAQQGRGSAQHALSPSPPDSPSQSQSQSQSESRSLSLSLVSSAPFAVSDLEEFRRTARERIREAQEELKRFETNLRKRK